jgi:hypothetical protein
MMISGGGYCSGMHRAEYGMFLMVYDSNVSSYPISLTHDDRVLCSVVLLLHHSSLFVGAQELKTEHYYFSLLDLIYSLCMCCSSASLRLF